MIDGVVGGGTGAGAGAGRARWTATYLGWPAYLACSWTWCIGMYLPILLRDMYGWSSVWAFSIANVCGVCLFGFAMRTAGRSRGLVAAHRRSMIWFSLLTIAFHIYFLNALWRWEGGHGAGFGIFLAVVVAGGSFIASNLSDAVLGRTAMGVYVFSVLVLLVLLGGPGRGGAWMDTTMRSASSWPVRDVGMGVFHWPLFAIGLLLCPYFDLTFHRAFQETAGQDSRVPFIAFGAMFSIMLLLTCVYWSSGLVWLVQIHIVVQSWFTMAVHWKEIDRVGATSESKLLALRPYVMGAALFASLLPMIDYRWWLLYVGLVFPSIAILTEVRRATGRRSGSTLGIAIFVVVLTPFCFGAFLLNVEWLAVIPGIAMVLALFWGAGSDVPRAAAVARAE